MRKIIDNKIHIIEGHEHLVPIGKLAIDARYLDRDSLERLYGKEYIRTVMGSVFSKDKRY